MVKQPNKSPQIPPEEENEHAEVYSVSQDQDGSVHFSRRDFLYFALAVGGTLLVKGVCPRFGAGPASTTTQPVQAGMNPFPSVYLHARPSIDSNIVDTLHPDDIVLLIGDHADLGWLEVATRSGQPGWLMRRFVDFSRAFTSASRDFGFASPLKSCGQTIQNGDFEAGHVSWVEESSHGTNILITNTGPDPHQGSWVALLGGVDNVVDKLTQLFHVPADVQDVQTLAFYLKVTTLETSTINVYDKLVLRLLDASGTPISSADTPIADNTTPMDWSHQSIQLPGFSNHADQDIQIQFKATTDPSNITNFVIDSVSLNLTCGTPTAAYDIYLPIIIMNGPTPTPTHTPTETPTPTHTPTQTPCASYTCSCNTAPCSANYNTPTSPCGGHMCSSGPYTFSTITPCSCNTNPCSCNAYPTGPTATFCMCHFGPCSCNAYPTGPTAIFCSCNTAPCTCNAFPCTCNAFPCTCNFNPCTCNIAPCSCNFYHPPCTCNFNPCYVT